MIMLTLRGIIMLYTYLMMINMPLLYNQDKIVQFPKIVPFVIKKTEIIKDSIRDLK